MTKQTIALAENQAKRFIVWANKAYEELEQSGSGQYIVGTKTSGALRRQSMELTRALAEMRKP
jgi:hypothetical protein